MPYPMPATLTSPFTASLSSEAVEPASLNWPKRPAPSSTLQATSNTMTPRKHPPSIVVADGGHFGTEFPVVADLCQRLEEAAAKNQWNITCETDPTSKDMLQYM